MLSVHCLDLLLFSECMCVCERHHSECQWFIRGEASGIWMLLNNWTTKCIQKRRHDITICACPNGEGCADVTAYINTSSRRRWTIMSTRAHNVRIPFCEMCLRCASIGVVYVFNDLIVSKVFEDVHTHTHTRRHSQYGNVWSNSDYTTFSADKQTHIRTNCISVFIWKANILYNELFELRLMYLRNAADCVNMHCTAVGCVIILNTVSSLALSLSHTR